MLNHAASLAIRQQLLVQQLPKSAILTPQERKNRTLDTLDRPAASPRLSYQAPEAAFFQTNTPKMDPHTFLAAVLQKVQMALTAFWNRSFLKQLETRQSTPAKEWLA